MYLAENCLTQDLVLTTYSFDGLSFADLRYVRFNFLQKLCLRGTSYKKKRESGKISGNGSKSTCNNSQTITSCAI